MKEREHIVVTNLVLLMLIVWVGFLLHHSPRFAGSFRGGVLGVSGALLMLFPLLYMVIKRIKWIKAIATKCVSLRMLLALHIYAGIIGPILVLLHTGHKFESPLGATLTALTIVVVLSGFVGRYLMSQFSREIREKKVMLTELQGAYSQARVELTQRPDLARLLRPLSGIFSRVFASLFLKDDVANQTGDTSPAMLLRLSESIADVEYAINVHEKFRGWFSKWLKLHIVISFALYALMVLHIWASIHFGLRWFDSWTQTTLKSENLIIVTSLNAPDEFSRSFSRLYQRYGRPSVTIPDYSKTLAALRQVDTCGFDHDDRKKVFWINVYNFTAMKLVAENSSVDSITESKVSAEKNPWSLKADKQLFYETKNPGVIDFVISYAPDKYV